MSSNRTHSAHEREGLMGKLLKSGAPGEIRTPDLLLRRQSLYPAELRARRIQFTSGALPYQLSTGGSACPGSAEQGRVLGLRSTEPDFRRTRPDFRLSTAGGQEQIANG